MIRLLPAAARVGLAVAVSLLALAVSRWAPFYAEPPLPVRALPTAALAIPLAVLASFGPTRRSDRRWRGFAIAALAAFIGLCAVAVLRPPGGLTCRASTPRGFQAELLPGPIELIGADLGAFPRSRRWSARWEGELRAPETGTYRLHTDGRGRVSVRIDGIHVLDARGESFERSVEQPLGRGPHRLEVLYQRRGPGPRLRLAWSPPSSPGGPPRDGVPWTIPPRHLGEERGPLLWRVTDALAGLWAVLVGALVLRLPWPTPARLPAPRRVTRRDVVAALGGYALLAVAMSWPLATAPARLGVVDRPDGRLNAWILAWDVHALIHEPGRLFQAPAFHPLPDALAFSENLVGAAVLAAPALLLGGPVLGYNSVWLVSLAVSGLGVNLLVRRVCGDRRAAFAAGALFAVGAFRWVNMAHLHAHATLFLPFALLAVDRFRERPTVGRGLALGGLVALQGLVSVYLGAITAIAVAVALALVWLGGMPAFSLLRVAPGILAAAAALAPVAYPYFRMRDFQGQEFGLDTLAAASATAESWVASGAWPYFELTRRYLDPDAVRDPLFPGMIPLLLGLAGLAAAPRRYRFAIAATSAVAFVLSLGPATPLYVWLHEHLVLFRGIRALSRFSIVPLLGLAVAAGLAVAGRRRAPWVALLLGLAEACAVPIPHGRYEPPGEASRWLAGRPGAVAYLPLGPAGDTQAMLDGLAHLRPMVNGDSGFIPRPYDRAMELLNERLDEDALRFLRAAGVTEVVARRETALPQLARFGDERIYAVPAGAAAEVPPTAPLRSTLWSANSVRADLGQPALVSRLTFEPSSGPWRPRPTIRVSLDGRDWAAVEARSSLADATLALMRDPRHGRGELRFAPQRVRYLELTAALPVPGTLLGVGP